MHHVFDEVPRENVPSVPVLNSVTNSNAIYGHHVAKLGEKVEARPNYNTSQYRPRGYNIGSLMSTYEEGDLYYKQPGHPLSELADKGGRFNELKNTSTWSPEKEAAKEAAKK
jgi:hypothetical protein